MHPLRNSVSLYVKLKTTESQSAVLQQNKHRLYGTEILP